MIAICDCNSFYAACHILFQANLWNKPVVVLSNNRGVIVSLNKQAKNLGFKRGMNEFENVHLFKKYNVQVFESNYTLYDDLSGRVIITIADFIELIQIESIDEVFASFKGYERFGYEKYARLIVDTVKKNVGIPISIGVAPTKTLAKIANRFAKKYPRFNNVFVMDTELKYVECLKRTKVEEVWGIKELARLLNAKGIFSAYDFVTKLTQKEVRMLHNVVLERTWCELKGIICNPVTPIAKDKKTVTCSRSFAEMVEDIDSLKQAVSTYAAICAAELRRLNSYAVKVRVSLHTNKFRDNQPQYNPYLETTLSVPSNASMTLVKCATQAAEDMFLEGFKYKSARVEVIQLTKTVQTSLYRPIQNEQKLNRISKVEDFYAHGFDRRLLALAVMGYGDRKKIDLRQENPHVYYTTRFSDIMRIDCR